MKGLWQLATAFTLVASVGWATAPAWACEPVHVIAYQHAAGSALTVKVNEAVVFRDVPGGSEGSATPRFLINGANTLEATLTGADPNGASAQIEVFRGCEGEFPKPVGENDNVLASLSVTGNDTAATTFELTGQPDTAWSTAEATDDDTGLIDAAKALIAAAKAKDVDAYVGFFKPMIIDMTARGMPAEQMLAGMAAGVFAEMEVVDAGPLSARPILDGRVWEVSDASGKAPLQFQGPGGEVDTLEQGMYWVRQGDAWGIVRQ